jgi:hypothetical protein
MEKVKFGIVWRTTDYCMSELANFVECSDGIPNDDGIRDRYEAFVWDVYAGRVKPSTLVEPELLTLFIGDLDNRAHIDYLEGHYADEPNIVAGGKRFWERCKKLRAIHPNLYRGM